MEGCGPVDVATATGQAVPGRVLGSVVDPVIVCVALAGAAVLVQVAYPLLTGSVLTAATVASVILFAATVAVHACVVFGARAGCIVVAVAAVIGWLAEAVGVHTGYPFGTYTYASSLGPQLLSVPLVVPLAWVMIAYPCLLLARRLAAGGHAGQRAHRTPGVRLLVAVTGGSAMAAWDVFLDPQMVHAGQWTWAWPSPGLPGVPGVPLTNYAGWLLVGVLVTAVLDQLAPTSSVRAGGLLEAVPAALLAWTWAGSTLANLVFFDRPMVALYGGATLGATVVPYLLVLARQRAATATAAPSTAATSAAATAGPQTSAGPRAVSGRPS